MDREESIKYAVKDGLFKKFFRETKHFVHLYQSPDNTLAGYSYFVKCLRYKNAQGASDAETIKYAVEQCKKEKYLSGIVDREGFIMVTQEDVLRILYPTEEMVREEGKEEGQLLNLIKLIQRKIHKSKTRDQIIDELELDEQEIKILDNFETYMHML